MNLRRRSTDGSRFLISTHKGRGTVISYWFSVVFGSVISLFLHFVFIFIFVFSYVVFEVLSELIIRVLLVS